MVRGVRLANQCEVEQTSVEARVRAHISPVLVNSDCLTGRSCLGSYKRAVIELTVASVSVDYSRNLVFYAQSTSVVLSGRCLCERVAYK